MKVEMTKHNMTRIVDSEAIPTLKAAGWMTKSPVVEQTQAEDVINLKPTARAKAAVKDASGDTSSNQGE
jgi:hypothetical protein